MSDRARKTASASALLLALCVLLPAQATARDASGGGTAAADYAFQALDVVVLRPLGLVALVVGVQACGVESPVSPGDVQWSKPSDVPPDELKALHDAYRGTGVTLERVIADLHSGALQQLTHYEGGRTGGPIGRRPRASRRERPCVSRAGSPRGFSP